MASSDDLRVCAKAATLDGDVEGVLDAMASAADSAAIEGFRNGLEALREPATIEKFREGRVRDALVDAVQKSDIMGRQVAAEVVGRLGFMDAAPVLLQALKSDSSSWVRNAAGSALGRVGGADAVEPLVEALMNDNLAVSHGAAEGLAAIGDPSGIEAIGRKLIALAKSRELQRQMSIERGGFYPLPQYVKALEQTGSPDAANALVPFLRPLYDQDPKALDGLLRVLVERGASVDALKAAVSGVPALEDSLAWYIKLNTVRI